MELLSRLEDTPVDFYHFDFIFYPPGSSKDQYSIYCLLTVSSLVLMSFLQKVRVIQEPEEQNQSSVDSNLVSWQPAVFKAALILSLIVCSHTFHTVFSLLQLVCMSILLFMKVDHSMFKFVKIVVLPLNLIIILWVYFSNLKGIYTKEQEEEMEWLIHLYKLSPTTETLISFVTFFTSSHLAGQHLRFEYDFFIFYMQDLRAEFWQKKQGLWRLFQLNLLDFLSFLLMLTVLIISCLNVTLFNIFLIYFCLYYFGLARKKGGILKFILGWTVLFMCIEYLNTLFTMETLGTSFFFQWLDLNQFDHFKIFKFDEFYKGKIAILILVWSRYQVYMFVHPIDSIQRFKNKKLLREKSSVFNFLFTCTKILRKVLFVGILIGMVAVLAIQEVNIVNWGFLVLIYVLLTAKIAIKIHKHKPKLYKLRILRVCSNILVGFSILMLFLQTIFQVLLNFEDQGKLNVKGWFTKNIPFLINYSQFFGLEILSESKIMIKFISLSFFFIASIILSSNLVKGPKINKQTFVDQETLADRDFHHQSTIRPNSPNSSPNAPSIPSSPSLLASMFPLVWLSLIPALALHWMVSLSMCLCTLTCVYFLLKPLFFRPVCLTPTSQKLVQSGDFKGFSESHLQQDFVLLWRYHRELQLERKLTMLKARQNVAFTVLAVVGLSVIIMYPTSLIRQYSEELSDKKYWDKVVFYLNWAGVFDRQTDQQDITTFLSVYWGYIALMFVMFIERMLQYELFDQLESQTTDLQREIKEEEMNQAQTTRDNLRTLIEAKNEALMLQMTKYMFQGLAIFVLLGSVGFMSNVFSIIYITLALAGIYFQGTQLLMGISAIAIFYEYFILLINFSDSISPTKLPVQPLPEYLIPVFDLENDSSFGFNSFMFGNDVSQKYAIWFQIVLLLIYSFMQTTYTLPLNCSMIPSLKETCFSALEQEHKSKREQTELTQEAKERSYQEIKRESAQSRWVLRYYFSSMLAQHVFVLAFSVLLLVQSISLFSICVLAILLYLLFKSSQKDFMKNEMTSWIKLLLLLMVIDIMIQLILQSPVYDKSKNSERFVLYIENIGWKILWNREKGPASKLDVEAFLDFLGKSAIIGLLVNLYYTLNEKVFSKTKQKELKSLFDMSSQKATCITQLRNNQKVKQIVLTQMDKKHRSILVGEIEEIVQHFEKERAFMRNPTLGEPPATPSPRQQQVEEVEASDRKFTLFMQEHKERLLTAMNLSIRKAQAWRQTKTNQVLFLTSAEGLDRVHSQVQEGAVQLDTELDTCIREDLKEWRGHRLGRQLSRRILGQKQEAEGGAQPDVHDLKRTSSYLQTRSDVWELFSAFIEVCVSRINYIAFALMVMSTCIEGSILTLPYPLAVFGYALLEEQRPKTLFWDYVVIYSLALIFVKFTVNFDLGQNEYLDKLKVVYFGLEPVKDGYEMVLYVLIQVLIVGACLLAKIVQNLQGFANKDEYQIEDIRKAMKRYLHNTTLEVRLQQLKNSGQIESDEKESGERQSVYCSKNKFEDSKDFMLQNQDFDQMREAYQSLREGGTTKVGHLSRSYFERLFPSVKEQKPGKDLYAWIFFFQLLILLYTLFIWSLMSRVKETLAESVSISFLDPEMVTFFILQFVLICIDRYLSVFKKSQVKETEFLRSSEKQVSTKVLIRNFDINYQPRYQDIMLSPDVIELVERKQQQLAAEAEISGENTDAHSDGVLKVETLTTQTQLIMKYYFLWFNLVLVHLLTFYYLPFRGNLILNGTFLCNPDSMPSCNEFTSNWALICFYFIFTIYFWLSASQIKHGYPEIRKSNFIMNRYDDGISGDLLFAFSMVPFLLEIKVLLDWTFTKTSLDIFQWFKFTIVHYDLFTYRCANYSYSQRKTGERISKCEKGICGGLFLTLIFVLLIGPLYLFSALNTNLNPITQTELSVSLEMENTQGMHQNLELFHTDSALQIRTATEKDKYLLESFKEAAETRFAEAEQIQEVTMSTYSDKKWDPVQMLRQEFIDTLRKPDSNIKLLFQANFQREVSLFISGA